jgi:tight adherence protein C
MDTSMVPVVAASLVFVAIVLVGVLVARSRVDAAKSRSLAMVSSYASTDVHQALAESELGPSAPMAPFLALGNRLVGANARRKLERQAVLAGESLPSAVENAVIRKVEYGLGGLILGLLLGVSSGGLTWLTVPGFALMGFYAPDLLLYNAGLKRDEEITVRLPDALDLLNLCVESGLSFQAALGQVAQNQEGPVAAEFALVLQEMQFGRSRGEALAAMGMRTRQMDVQRFISAMLQVDKLGVPVATVLREQAKEMRAKRYARAREQAQKVPVKILMPLMLCFLPALFIIILGPAAYSIVQVFSKM